jgi:phospholipid/cholesterol/gamma-HCH transport system permease protein
MKMESAVADLGSRLVDAAAEAGGLLVLLGRCLRAPFSPSFEWREMLRQTRAFGVGSLLVLGSTAALVGGILVVQAGLYVRRFGIQELVGWFAGFGILRDVGPLVAGLVFSGRVGSRNAAELASMATRDQLEGLRAIGLDTVRTVVAPRALAMLVSLVGLYFLGSFISIATAALSARLLLGIDGAQFLRSFLERTNLADLGSGALKSVLFAMAVALVSCRAGLLARGGAAAVGDAAKQAVVRGALAIVVLDLAVARVL